MFPAIVKSALMCFEVVIPAEAGIQKINELDPGLRRGDDYFSVSLNRRFS